MTTPVPPGPTNPAERFATGFLDSLTEEASHYIMQLPLEAYDSAKLAILRRIFHDIDQRDQATRGGNISHLSQAADNLDDDNMQIETDEDQNLAEEEAAANFEKSSSQIPVIKLDDDDMQVKTDEDQNLAEEEAAANFEKSSSQIPVIKLDDDDDDANPGSKTSQSVVTASIKRGPGRPRNSVDGPPAAGSVYNQCWGAITTTQEFKLPKILREHLAANSTHDAAEFLTDSVELPTTGIPGLDGFPQLCRKIQNLPRKATMPRVGRLFLKLLLGDIACRFGPTVFGLKKAIINSHDELTYADLQPALKAGRNLALLCKWFGTGCIFWLSDQLSDTFLASRFTTSGPFYEKAMKHIKHLGLLESIETSSANKLGDAIRAQLARVYEVKQFGSDAMEKAPGEMEPDEGESINASEGGM